MRRNSRVAEPFREEQFARIRTRRASTTPRSRPGARNAAAQGPPTVAPAAGGSSGGGSSATEAATSRRDRTAPSRALTWPVGAGHEAGRLALDLLPPSDAKGTA